MKTRVSSDDVKMCVDRVLRRRFLSDAGLRVDVDKVSLDN